MSTIDRVRDASVPQLFPEPRPVMPLEVANEVVAGALAVWRAATREESHRIATVLETEFPDQARPDDFWHSESSSAFRDFFVWGHNHDFGSGYIRRGAMDNRHAEIAAEALHLGMLPANLQGKQVLDVGCWSGGDLLVLAGLGRQTTAMEEASLFADRQDWAQRFDYAYCSGVIYHVTDPVLLLRILFAYLKPGGEVFLETKAATGEGSMCGYSGTLEKGGNWYAPNETALGRWLVDAGFDASTVRIYRRSNGRLLASGCKTESRVLRETAGFSRPGSWLKGAV